MFRDWLMHWSAQPPLLHGHSFPPHHWNHLHHLHVSKLSPPLLPTPILIPLFYLPLLPTFHFPTSYFWISTLSLCVSCWGYLYSYHRFCSCFVFFHLSFLTHSSRAHLARTSHQPNSPLSNTIFEFQGYFWLEVVYWIHMSIAVS